MKSYAQILDGRVFEVISPIIGSDGEEIPIEQRFTPQFVSTLVDVTGIFPVPTQGMAYDGVTFSVYVDPAPSADQVIAINAAERDARLQSASVALAPLQMAVSLGEATDAEASAAKAWVAYARAVKLVDLSLQAPVWPDSPSI
jgi:hypothetical protein